MRYVFKETSKEIARIFYQDSLEKRRLGLMYSGEQGREVNTQVLKVESDLQKITLRDMRKTQG